MFLIMLLSCCISMFIFSNLFYWLNCSKFELFKLIQYKVDTLNKKRILKLGTNIFIIMIGLFLLILNINHIIVGFILGIISSFRDICFRNTYIDIFKKEEY